MSARLPLSDASEIMQRGQKLEESTSGGWRQSELWVQHDGLQKLGGRRTEGNLETILFK